jgi:septum formation protein
VLILASRSASRRAMLDAAGIVYQAEPAAVDERAIEAGLGAVPAAQIALALAQAKALAVSAPQAGQLVLGSDSLVVCGGKRFDKPRDRAEAAAHLRHFSGQTMELHSAGALVRDGAVVWDHTACARLRVAVLSEAFIADYLDHEWPAVAGCVGVFRIEGRGVHLFESIDGDYFTILGMPLLAVLGALRAFGELPQ